MKPESKIMQKTNNILLNIFLLFVLCSTLFAVNYFGQSITWQREFPEYYGIIRRVQQTYDGGYIAVGVIRVANTNKMRLMKFNPFGDSLWSKIIGVGSTSGYWVEETLDRGLIIGGSTDTGIGNQKAYLVKTDSLGNIQWQKTFSNSDIDQCRCVKQTTDGGYILSCRTAVLGSGNAMFIKTDQSGNQLWLKWYGDWSNQIVNIELQILQDGYITTGSNGEFASSDAYVMRLNLNGDTLWTKRYGGNASDGCFSISLVPAPYNGFIIGGYSKSFSSNGNANCYIVKIDDTGNLEWQRTYSTFGGYDECKSIIYKPNMGYIISGTSDSLNNGIAKAKIRKIDFTGNVIFETSFLPAMDDEASFFNVNLTNDGGLILGGFAGNGYPGFYIVKTDSLGFANPIGISSNQNHIPNGYVLYQNYPNPFNPVTKIKFSIPLSRGVYEGQLVTPLRVGVLTQIKIYDITGREVYTYSDTKQPGTYEILFDGTNLASGMYFYAIIAGDSYNPFFKETKKMVLLK